MKNRKSAALATIGMAAAGAVLVAGCASTNGSQEANESVAQATPTTQEAQTPEPTSTDAASENSGPSETTTSEEAVEDQRPFLLESTADPVRYPVDTSTILSNVEGDIPADQYTANWKYEYRSDADGNISLQPSYSVNPNMQPPANHSDPGIGTWTCIESADGNSRSCGATGPGFSMSRDGEYEFYNQDYDQGSGDPIKGSKVELGSFTYTQPAAEKQLQPAMCELTRGTAALDGDNYTITVDHRGDCSSSNAWLGNVAAIVVIPDHGQQISQLSGVTQISHSDTETVISVAKKDVDYTLQYFGPDDATASSFQVTSGSLEPGYEASSISIDVT